MSGYPYPDVVPVAEGTRVVEIFREGRFASRKATLAHDGWVIQGYLQYLTFGVPEEDRLVGASHFAELTEDQFADKLDELIQAAAKCGANDAPAQLGPVATILLRFLLKRLLESL